MLRLKLVIRKKEEEEEGSAVEMTGILLLHLNLKESRHRRDHQCPSAWRVTWKSLRICVKNGNDCSGVFYVEELRTLKCTISLMTFLAVVFMCCMGTVINHVNSHRESEQFEDTAIDRADALLKDVYALRDALQVEKDALTGRLKNVVGILDK